MRRKDRQITNPEKMEAILQQAACCRLGLVDSGNAYIVPMNFGFVKENGRLSLYFHSSPKGKKIDLILQNGRATFEVESGCGLKEGSQACEYSYHYQSVIGSGPIALLTDEADKLHALRCVTSHYAPGKILEINPKMLPVVVGIRLDVEEWTAKAYQPQA